MRITIEYLSGLHHFYAIARGWKTGILGDWKTTEIFVSGFSSPIYKGFSKSRDAVNFLLAELLIRAEKGSLEPEEMETLDSCKKLVDQWRRETEAERMI